MSHSFGWYILRSFLIINFVSSSCMQLNSINPFQSKYNNAGQASNALPGLNNEKSPQSAQPTPPVPSNSKNDISDSKMKDEKNVELQRMVQQLYMAQAQVQLEATEIRRAQSVASEAQKRLEEASNNVRVITTALRSAQETIATTAQHAQTAQLQLAAHDQLLFTARQKKNSGSALGSATYTADDGLQTRNVKPYSPNWNDYKQYLMDQQKKLEKNLTPSKLKRSNFAYQLDRSNMNQSSMDRSNMEKQKDFVSSEKMKTLLDWIHEENRKDLLMQ